MFDEIENFPGEEEGGEAEDSSEDDSKKKKKKRETSKSLEVATGPEKKLSFNKQAFQWSNIFGLDRKKKSMGLIFHPLEEADKGRKRCEAGGCDEYDDNGR